MRNNPRVYLPQARPTNEELELATKEFMYATVTNEYIAEHCNEKGAQLESNLTKPEQRGKAKLNARVEKGQIVINSSDKSNLTSISTMENYKQQGKQHIGPRDRKLNWKEVNQIRETVNKHARAISNIFQPGKKWGEDEEGRVRKTLHKKVTTIPKVSAQA